MKYKELQNGEQIQVGDIVVIANWLGKRNYVVHRLTKKYSWVKYNDVGEGKYPLVYNSFSFCSLPKEKWCTTNYKVYRAIKEEKTNND